jgi:hypothetical protein
MDAKKSIKAFFCLILVLTITLSCNRNAAPTNNFNNIKAKDIVDVLDTTGIQFNELKARFKIKADLNGDSRTFNADIRWQKDQQIWMSFSILGFEGVRALFTQDSVHLINKLEDQYFYGDYSALEKISQVPLTFNEIQNLLMGKWINIDDNKPDIQIKGGSALIEMQDDLYKAKINVDKATLSIQHFLITSWLGKRSLDVTLSEYQLIENKNWPTKRTYNIISGENYLNIDATAQKITLNEILEYPFYINPKYEKIPLQNFR